MVRKCTLWDSGFNAFKRRIGEQLQLGGLADDVVDDAELLSFYRMGRAKPTCSVPSAVPSECDDSHPRPGSWAGINSGGDLL